MKRFHQSVGVRFTAVAMGLLFACPFPVGATATPALRAKLADNGVRMLGVNAVMIEQILRTHDAAANACRTGASRLA